MYKLENCFPEILIIVSENYSWMNQFFKKVKIFDTRILMSYAPLHVQKLWPEISENFFKTRMTSLHIDKIVTKFCSWCL